MSEVAGRFTQVIASNIQTYGGGLFWMAREARLDDGLLDLWLFEGDSFSDSLSHVINLLTGKR
jgi:diacylglycerol kinase family enzyme